MGPGSNGNPPRLALSRNRIADRGVESSSESSSSRPILPVGVLPTGTGTGIAAASSEDSPHGRTATSTACVPPRVCTGSASRAMEATHARKPKVRGRVFQKNNKAHATCCRSQQRDGRGAFQQGIKPSNQGTERRWRASARCWVAGTRTRAGRPRTARVAHIYHSTLEYQHGPTNTFGVTPTRATI